jgi:hypothetical protein
MRLTCDTPAEQLINPRRFLDKAFFYQKIRETMLIRHTRQGRLYRGLCSPGCSKSNTTFKEDGFTLMMH